MWWRAWVLYPGLGFSACFCACVEPLWVLLLSRDMHGLNPPNDPDLDEQQKLDGKISYEKLQHQTIISSLLHSSRTWLKMRNYLLVILICLFVSYLYYAGCVTFTKNVFCFLTDFFVCFCLVKIAHDGSFNRWNSLTDLDIFYSVITC